jgi:rhodanese-related sulfurtransferase
MTIVTISPAELAEVLRAGGGIELIDVRTPMEFREVHLVSARNIPLDTLAPAKVMEARNGSKEAPLYIVCRSGSRGKQACEMFLAAGFSNIINVEGGTLACVEHGMEVVRGKKMVALDRQVRIAAGLMIMLFSLLGWLVHPLFIALVGLIGAGLVCAGVTEWCGLGMALAKMPWNQIKDEPAKTCCGQ